MPIIELQTQVNSDADLEFGFWGEADLLVPFSLVASGNFGIEPDPDSVMDNAMQMAADMDFGIDIDPDSVLRLGAEANVFLESEDEFGLDIDPDSEMSQVLDFVAVGQVGIQQVARTDTWSQVEVDELNILLDIVPNITFPANYQHYKFRFKIDSTEIPIRNFSVNAAPQKIGQDFSVGLSRLTDRSLFSLGSIYKLEVAFVIGGVPQWYTLVEGTIISDQYNISQQNSAPTDAVSLSSASLLINKLNISPYFPTVFYDSNYREMTEDSFESYFDVAGNEFPTTLLAIPGLTFLHVLNNVFTIIGLNYYTNIPNYKLKVVQVGMGQPYYSVISGLMGIYEPLILERSGDVHILDSTILVGDGFDDVKTITPTNYKTLQYNKDYADINGYILEYVENIEEWDNYDDDEVEDEDIITDVDENKITRILTTTTIRKYYRNSLPAVPVRQAVIKTLIQTFVTDPVYFDGEVMIDESTEEFEYDSVGKIEIRTKTESARVPVWHNVNDEGGYWQYDFLEIKTEKDEYTYKNNQKKPGTEYRAKLTQTVQELIYIDPDQMYETQDVPGQIPDLDPDKEVPVDYKIRYIDAYRSGRLEEEGISAWETTVSRLEKVTPTTEELAKVFTKEVDHLTNITTVSTNEEEVGEYSVNAEIGQTRICIVYGTGGSRDTRRMEKKNINEIPLPHGVAWAQRKINKQNTNDVKMDVELIGIDIAIKRGTLLKIIGRNSQNLGNFITEGYTINGNDLGLPSQSVMTNVQVVKV